MLSGVGDFFLIPALKYNVKCNEKYEQLSSESYLNVFLFFPDGGLFISRPLVQAESLPALGVSGRVVRWSGVEEIHNLV